ncbi:YbaB/EbfC family nucleoid-associated protein [Desulfopila inferna]|uniref:YbaB/EbfC family nucleoid-associated protein n=1 Tax=Desulfopila inferna TaxID=468528 RepID=UPI0019653598|nr:YbaB/EbfC family nucleoid-associated protein [Desulfopila inferna]MBM9605992.1 YbaB/EbfC family nucleoid-associated protein [Desulfopila inferna]
MDLQSIMQQAQQMQAKMAEIQEQLASKTITGSAGGGMVNVIVNGKGEVLSMTIEDAILSAEEKEMLQDLIVAATNDGLRKAKELGKEEMKQLTGGLNLPGLSNMF